MSENKILFAGSADADVSAAITIISDANGNDADLEMDYGILKLESSDQIQLYSIAGIEEINAIPASLSENCIGLILLLNNSEPEAIQNTLQKVHHYQQLVGEEAIAVGLTNHDDSPVPDINEYHVALREANLHIPVFSVNVNDKHDVITLIKALLFNLDSGVS